MMNVRVGSSALASPAADLLLIELLARGEGRLRLEALGTVAAAVQRPELELVRALCTSYGAARAHPLLGRTVVRIGRAPDNDVVLADATVSSFHAELRWDARGQRWTAVDLKSRNGTLVNGEPARARVPLAPGAFLLVGEAYFILHTREVYQRTVAAAARAVGRGH